MESGGGAAGEDAAGDEEQSAHRVAGCEIDPTLGLGGAEGFEVGEPVHDEDRRSEHHEQLAQSHEAAMATVCGIGARYASRRVSLHEGV